ncbi:lysyl oxidase family protein [Luteolibacter flavescens]|uniref:Lysyl oxidase family protein n=1 Tax=Luteolibacter flavescens TaxID=1859460 RepID=A0ABT3FL70_9BACT|nr:lysyl oxidase family protein [Luteolibacter flavescens]MCW1884311.1 lysyl oxidase family protein [Luteolibacter flavescens]
MKPVLPLLVGLLCSLPVLAHEEVTPFPKVVQGGVPMAGLTTTDPHGLTVYRLVVPEGTTRLTVTTNGGTGNLQLFVRRAVHPGYNGAGAPYSSRFPGTRQRLVVEAPEPGIWYIGTQGANGGYNGVRILAALKQEKGAAPAVTMNPPPGIYTGSATFTLKAKGSTVRYTTDGSEPDATSPVVPASLTLTADTTVKARAFTSKGAVGPVTEGFYQVHPAGDVRDLDSLGTVHHLASAKGGRHIFRISVPANQKLVVVAEGGKGKSTVSVGHGTIPPVGKPAKGDTSFVRSNNRVVIPETTAGDYYIAVDAASIYSGRTVMAYVAGDGADLMPWGIVLQPYVSTETFDPVSCEVQEGMIDAGERRLLRYTTEIRNVGGQDMVMPDPEGNPFFEFQECHNHYHFKGFASSRLLDMEGNELRVGRKVSFCLLDTNRWDRGANVRKKFTCSSQGIQAGWGDVYDSGLPGQWIEIDTLPAGTYQLEVTVNPDHILPETNYDNNRVVIPVTIN